MCMTINKTKTLLFLAVSSLSEAYLKAFDGQTITAATFQKNK